MPPPNDKQETPEETLKRLKEELSWRNDGYEPDDLAKAYHTARQKIEQQAPAKTLPECKDEVARSNSFIDWNDLLSDENVYLIDSLFDQAAELYAKQFRRPIEVTDDEIDEEAKMHLSNNKSSCPDDQTEGLVSWSFNKGASWMREKLNGKQ